MADPLKLNFEKGSCIDIYFMKMHAYRLILKARVSRRVFFIYFINVSDTYTHLINIKVLKVSLYN